jgi:uncharacterized membrane protein YgdD (TMEM256/DUF423 family)
MKFIAITGAMLGFTSVMMGAAGDHLFSGLLTAQTAERIDVALRYHQLYAILILCLGLYGLHNAPSPAFKWSGYIFCAGTVLFCGSLYTSVIPGLDKATHLTPVGGATLMLGWVLCFLSIRRF